MAVARAGETAEPRLDSGGADGPSNLRGILAMIGACAAFAVGDTIMKLVADMAPTSELIFIRGLFVLIGAVVISAYLGAFAVLHRAMSGMMALRAAGDTTGAWSFQMALARMPYADLSAIGQLTPLCITAASALLLGAKVGWRRWTATAAGLLGVLLIIRPGSSTFTWWALVGLGAVLGATVRDLATRKVDPGVPSPLITVFSAGLTTATSALVGLGGGWTWPSWTLVGGLFLAAVFSLVGQQCTILAVRTGDIAAVMPFRYMIIVFAIISGVLVFGHVPDLMALAGILIVCAAGLYTFYREQQLRREAGR
jgi:drug/metabolite transporter (DMT)-like permease